MPKDLVAVEILEYIEAEISSPDACKKLKQFGYTLVLDDYKFEKKHDDFLVYVDIVCVRRKGGLHLDVIIAFKNNLTM